MPRNGGGRGEGIILPNPPLLLVDRFFRTSARARRQHSGFTRNIQGISQLSSSKKTCSELSFDSRPAASLRFFEVSTSKFVSRTPDARTSAAGTSARETTRDQDGTISFQNSVSLLKVPQTRQNVRVDVPEKFRPHFHSILTYYETNGHPQLLLLTVISHFRNGTDNV